MALAAAKRRRKKRKPARCAPPKRRRTSKARGAASEDRLEAVESRRKRASRRRKRRPPCRKKRRRRARRPTPRPAPKPVPSQPVPPPPAPVPPRADPATPVYSGPFGVREAERLLWRAGFGPSPGHAQALADMGLRGAVHSLTRPAGPATFTGADPTVGGAPLEPADAWGHDHLWFLDRMVRTSNPLVERMTLIWHDWFATSTEGASQRRLLDQNATLRRNWCGSFEQLALDVTTDPAMILWLNQNENTRWDPNENYARELMELFTLGADRGAYTEDDVRELARALTGWRADWSAEEDWHDFRFDSARHDPGNKTVFGRTGAWNWRDAVRLCLENPKHATFFVEKLWSYFIPVPPSAADRDALAAIYVNNGRQVRPVLEAILLHPQLHAGPRMVKPPVVYLAGLLRRLRRSVDTNAWVWLGQGAGQQLFRPPNVSGWDDDRWLDTSTLRARWMIVSYLLLGRQLDDAAMNAYDPTETPEAAVQKAREFWGNPPLTAEGLASLHTFASTCLPPVMANWEQRYYRAIRQNALRQLLAVSPDLQTS